MERVAIVGNPDMNNLGNSVHGFMCCDCDGLSVGDQEVIAHELLEAHGVSASLRAQISCRFSANSWHTSGIGGRAPRSTESGPCLLRLDLLNFTGPRTLLSRRQLAM